LVSLLSVVLSSGVVFVEKVATSSLLLGREMVGAMEYGEQVYRRIYGRGGLSDQLASAVGLRGALGAGTPGFNLTSQQTSALIQHALHDAATLSRIRSFQASATVAAGDVGAVNCDCVISNIDADDATLTQLRAACAADPPTFGATMANQGISLECAQPWYKEPRNLLIIGGAVGLGVLAWVVLR
jgi:hypothetical protein